MPLDEGPETLEVRLGPVRIDDEVSGHAVAELASDRHGLGACDRRSCPWSGSARPALVAASRPKKMSNSRAIGRHASSSSGCRATMSTRVWTSIQFFRSAARRRRRPARGCATDDARTDRRRRRSDRRSPRNPRQTLSIDRSRTARSNSCQTEQNEQRNGQPRAVSIRYVGR